MSENYSRSLLRISVAQICQNLGWNSAQSSSLEVLTDVLERYLLQLGGICHRYSEQFGRTEPNLDDLGLAFKHMCINVSELEDYVHHVDPVPFAHELVAFPSRKSSNLEFPNPQSREILLHREEHVDNHLPYMFPHLKDEVPSDNQTNSILNNTAGIKEEPKSDDPSMNGEGVGEKRPASNGSLEMPSSKRQRMGNPSLPEEAGQSQYEMTCVFMNQNGVLTTRPGCQGKLPEARLPPPNPRNISENNKENKNKDSSNSSKNAVTGGIGADSVVKNKGSKKSSHKKGLHIHESAARAAVEMTSKEIGKKSASSKVAAKFIKKLKITNKSSKIFGKKTKEAKSKEDFNRIGGHERIEDMHKGKGTKKKKKEKKSVAIVDSDEELRNLSSPSSFKVPSPDHSTIIGSDGGDNHKAAMDAISDSINAVLREGHDDHPKGKRRKKKDGKTSEASVNNKEAVEAKPPPKKKGRPPGQKSKEKKQEPTPVPVDIKPFVSDKYSSAELQVYEFNDSPPDASSIKSRRPSAPDDSSPSKANTSQSTSHSNSSHVSSHGHQKSVKIVEQEELFAPEIKIESRADVSSLTVKPLKLDLDKEKEKGKSKDEKEKKSNEEKDKHKVKNEKEEKRKDKNKENDSKEKLKDKEVKKDKKDKKKDKEKKKKHKEKDRDRDKEKDKRREEKVKQQDARESRESSPALGHGVKLKIKIGGSAGPSASMMVTGDEMNASSPSPSLPPCNSKRESMSPPKVVPKLYITKKGQEEKTKKSVKHGSKSSPLSLSIKSGSLSPSSNAASPSLPSAPSAPHKSPTQTPSRKTPTPPPFAQYSDRKSHSPAPKDIKEKREPPVKEKGKKGKSGHVSRKDKEKKKNTKLSSSSAQAAANKSSKPRSRSPKRTRRSSPSLEHSQSPAKSRSRSPSPASHHRSASPPSVSRRKSSISPATSKGTTSSRRHQSPSPHLSPSKPPTPGSTSPNAAMDWNLQESPLHNSPMLTMPNTPVGSPHRSPSHSSLPRTPNPHRSPSPTDSPHTSPIGRTATPEANTLKDAPSPVSSGKSSAGAKSRTVETETVCIFIDDLGQKVWICPECKLQDDGSEMIGCDKCDNWYHWTCVGITAAPPEEQAWFCRSCTSKTKSSTRGGSRGRGRPRGRGRGRGRKKIT